MLKYPISAGAVIDEIFTGNDAFVKTVGDHIASVAPNDGFKRACAKRLLKLQQ
jgi:hypothetical protein